MTKVQPKALYIHIPFCESICNYCDFPKLQYFHNFALKYISSLKKEILSYNISSLSTIYIGGGTPTCLEDSLFLDLLKFIYPLCKNVKEYTIEANPESLTINKLKIMKKYGVNRLSIGVESTNNKILKTLNRNHTFQDVVNSIENAKKIGFSNINVDLIIGLPNVSEKMLRKDITNLISLNVNHISCYSLTIHPNTIFGIQKLKEISPDLSRKYYDIIYEELKKANYIHYEVSNWAKKGFESIHNKTYWQNKQYYGTGLGAAGYINDFRYTNTKSINDYIKGHYLLEKEKIIQKDKITYQIILNLRTNKGLSLKKIKNMGYDILKLKNKEINNFLESKIIKISRNNLIATYDGMMILDQILLNLIP